MDYVGGRRKKYKPRRRKPSKSKSKSKSAKRRRYSPQRKRRSYSPQRKRRSYTPRKYSSRDYYDDNYYTTSSSDDDNLTISRTIKYYTLLDEYGNELGGRYSGYSPAQAVRKLRDQWWNGRNNARVIVRQTTPGRNNGRIYVFNVKRTQVPAPPYMRNLTGYNTMWQKTPYFHSSIDPEDAAMAIAKQKSLLDYVKATQNTVKQ